MYRLTLHVTLERYKWFILETLHVTSQVTLHVNRYETLPMPPYESVECVLCCDPTEL